MNENAENAEDGLGDAWTDTAVADALAVSDQTVGIGTEVNTDVEVTVELLARAPGDADDVSDHVVEPSLRVPSGRIAVLGCTDYLPDAARFDVPRASCASAHRARTWPMSVSRAEKAMTRQKPSRKFTFRSGLPPTARRP